MSGPTIRADLRIDREPDGRIRISDPVSAQVHTLPPVGALIFDALRETDDLAEIAARVRARFPDDDIDTDDVQSFVRDLRNRLVFDLRETRDALARLRQTSLVERSHRLGLLAVREMASDPDVSVRDGLRYTCLSCGMCCSGRFRVELSPRDEAVIAGLDLQRVGRTLDTAVDTADYDTPGAQTSRLRRWLRHENGRCVFLGEDMLCEIHRHFGYDKKPLGCRIFPFTPVQTPAGVILQFRPECSTQHRSSDTGGLVAERTDAIWAEIADGMALAPTVPESFELRPDDWTDYHSYVALETHWRHLARASGWRACLAAVGHDVGFAQGTPAEALRTLVTFVVEDLAHRPKRLQEELEQLVPNEHAVPTLALAAATLGLPVKVDGAPITPALVASMATALTAIDAWDDQFERYLDDCLYGKFAFLGLSVASGAGLLALSIVLARLSTAAAATIAGRNLEPDLLNEAIVAWHMALYNRDKLRLGLLARHRAALETVLELEPAGYP